VAAGSRAAAVSSCDGREHASPPKLPARKRKAVSTRMAGLLHLESLRGPMGKLMEKARDP
jgi:hypothetical protein